MSTRESGQHGLYHPILSSQHYGGKCCHHSSTEEETEGQRHGVDCPETQSKSVVGSGFEPRLGDSSALGSATAQCPASLLCIATTLTLPVPLSRATEAEEVTRGRNEQCRLPDPGLSVSDMPCLSQLVPCSFGTLAGVWAPSLYNVSVHAETVQLLYFDTSVTGGLSLEVTQSSG